MNRRSLYLDMVRTLCATGRIIGSTLVLALLLSLGGGDLHSSDVQMQLAASVAGMQFDFISWTVPAVADVAAQTISAAQNYLSDDARSQVVEDYFELLGYALAVTVDIENSYANPAITDPIAATEEAARELQVVRDKIMSMQPLAQAIMQEQISTILIDEGFGVLGLIIPPVTFRITDLPDQIVVSPRDRIQLIASAYLAPGLALQEHVELEALVDARLNVASVVVPIAGLSTFPAMVYETAELIHVVEIGTHEWAHMYLATRPLGLHYDVSPQLRGMNETTANILGKAVGYRVIERYFPEQAAGAGRGTVDLVLEAESTDDFKFRSEMRDTRIHAEQLLAQGAIEQAETYMEERRRFFAEHGYRIRKLNQAYFAFHGAYADEPGAAGEDLVGPAVVELWERSNSIREFVATMAGMTSFVELQIVLADG